jgi:hypothetical protein
MSRADIGSAGGRRYSSKADQIQSYIRTEEQPGGWCCKYASAVCYSLGLYCEMLLKDYMHRVSDRLLSETSTSEIAIDGRRPPCATRSDIKRPVYISHSLTGRQKNNNAVIINVHLCSHSEQFAL